MTLKIDRLIYIGLLLLFCTTAFGQPYRKLTVNDFRGEPNTKAGPVVAYTNCSIEFSYVAKREHDYYILTFDIHLTMNSNESWMDKSRITSPAMMAEILKHEQGHYNIAYMEQQELLRVLSHTVFYSNYEAVAKNIFNRVDAKYRQLNLDYDEDTQHSTNRVQQQSWDAYFKKKLEFMPPA
jgi:hypothetical protein